MQLYNKDCMEVLKDISSNSIDLMGRNIKTTIKLPTKKVIFEFEAMGDWEPQTNLCWTGCPFSVCTSLGQSCLALKHQTCPFVRNLTTEYDEG